MKPSIFRAATCCALWSLCAGIASAQDLPRRKPGLWDTSMEFARRPGQPIKSQLCVDEKTDSEMQRRAMDDSIDARCEHKVTRRSAGLIETEYHCTSPRGKSDGTTKITGSLDSQYALESHSRYDPPRNGVSESSIKMQAQWMGACPAGMKGGEVRMTGGVPGRPGGAASGARTMTPEQLQQMQQMMEQMRKQRGG
jgi:hypothetical protein